MSKVKRVTIPGYIVILNSSEPLELCTEDNNTLTEANEVSTSHLLIGNSASVFSSRAAARAAIKRTTRRAVKEGTFFGGENIRFNVMRLIGVPA